MFCVREEKPYWKLISQLKDDGDSISQKKDKEERSKVIQEVG